MLTILAAIASVWAAITSVPHFVGERDCLAEAVLAESTLAKEPVSDDHMVAYDIYQRSLDGRWGKTICGTVAMKYPIARVRRIRITIRSKHRRGRSRTRLIAQHYTTWVCDYSYRCLRQYNNITAKAPADLYARALLVADEQMMGEYTPPAGFEAALHYQNPGYAAHDGSKWFDCTTKEIGRVDPASAHVFYRDATDEELDETLLTHPECKKFIDAFRRAKAENGERHARTETTFLNISNVSGDGDQTQAAPAQAVPEEPLRQ